MTDVKNYVQFRQKVVAGVEKVIAGKTDCIEKILIAFLCGGHVLLDDVPGTGKTMLLRAFAATVGGSMKRIQFTPDLLPSDLTGIHFYNQKSGEFEFRPGPVFANLILADEINRATPRTQSALLEAMAERQVTVDGITFPMSEPFMIMATQNPLESYGTFPLPEAQTDRFFMRLTLGYMERAQEIGVILGEDTAKIVSSLECITTPEEIAALKDSLPEIHISSDVVGYLMDIIEATRSDNRIRIGVSARGTIALLSAARANAAIHGRDYVQPEDVKELAPCVLAHRLTLTGSARRGSDLQLIRDILDTVSVPLENVNP